MDKKPARVLLIGKNETDSAGLRRYLEEQGCDCRFVPSYAAGMALFEQTGFDLILCSGQPGIRALFPSVAGSSASVFCAHAIEDGCLWVPVILNGKECLGLPPLRPSEFAETIQRIVDGIRGTSDRSTGAGDQLPGHNSKDEESPRIHPNSHLFFSRRRSRNGRDL